MYRRLAGTGRTSAEVGEVVPAACAGRVETVLVALGRDVWGRFDPDSGRVELHKAKEPGDDELTNLAVVSALRHGRAVHTLPPDEMPNGVAMVAVFPLPRAKHGLRP
jgi:hypothetical protein